MVARRFPAHRDDHLYCTPSAARPAVSWPETLCAIQPSPSYNPSPVRAQHGWMCQSWPLMRCSARDSVISATVIASRRSCARGRRRRNRGRPRLGGGPLRRKGPRCSRQMRWRRPSARLLVCEDEQHCLTELLRLSDLSELRLRPRVRAQALISQPIIQK